MSMPSGFSRFPYRGSANSMLFTVGTFYRYRVGDNKMFGPQLELLTAEVLREACIEARG